MLEGQRMDCAVGKNIKDKIAGATGDSRRLPWLDRPAEWADVLLGVSLTAFVLLALWAGPVKRKPGENIVSSKCSAILRTGEGI